MAGLTRRSVAAASLTMPLLGSRMAWAQDGDELSSPEEVVKEAETTLGNFVKDPDIPWFRNNVQNAKGMLIVPVLLKGGFFLGGSGGSGALLVRGDDGTWSQPAFYTMGSVSFGLQAGGEIAEVILLVQSDRGVDSFLVSEFKLGADVSIAAGPVGTGAAVQTADILAFSRSKGLFGGITVDGSIIKVRDSWNEDYYGKPVSPREILYEGAVSNPQADPLRKELADEV